MRRAPARHGTSRLQASRPTAFFTRAFLPVAALLALALMASACDRGPREAAETVDVRIPSGASAAVVSQRLHEAGLVDYPRLFRIYLRLTGSSRSLHAGHYRFRSDANWSQLVDKLQRGEVVRVPLTVPEGFTLRRIAPRVASFTGVPTDSVLALMRDPSLAEEWGVPGPTLEGYLFPDTYHFVEGLGPRAVLRAMVDRYRSFWGDEERRRAEEMGLTEQEAVTLASIVETEARVPDERRVIAGVFLNRLEIGMLLQADPTVQYLLEERQARLLYRHIDEVADDPYNTYTHPGLPPGPIASPGEAALRAVLDPADVPYLFFVARSDGSHVFTTNERDHINAKNRIRARQAAGER